MSVATLRVALGQLPNVVGDISGNAQRIAEAMDWAEAESADVLVLPEMILTGYPLGDLALHREFVAEAEAATAALAVRSASTVTVVGTVARVPPRRSWDSMDRSLAISAAVLTNGEHRGSYHKILLPNREVFDEGRNFAPGRQPDAVWGIGDVTAGICICEDLWSDDGPPEAQGRGGAQVLLVQNASPYDWTKAQGRRDFTSGVARRNGLPVVYVNMVGGQDELVFDGGSLVVDAGGSVLHQAASFEEDRLLVDLRLAPTRPVTGRFHTVHTRPLPRRTPTPPTSPRPSTVPELPAESPAVTSVTDVAGTAGGTRAARPVTGDTTYSAGSDEALANVWRAIVTGTRDFARKNGFSRAILGLSGGIDAAITAAVAAEALEPGRVLGVAMPGPNTPDHELLDAQKVAESLGIRFDVVPLDPMLAGMATALAADPPDLVAEDVTRENLDSLDGLEGLEGLETEDDEDTDEISEEVRDVEHRARAVVLTAISDVRGHLVLATGNRTELSIGGATIYGDMVGGFAPLKDCPKSLLYRLARHRDAAAPAIPRSVLSKPSSAQQDTRANLPPFDVLDAIVERYVQHGDGVEDLIALGYDAAVVVDVLRRVDRAEIQRRQIPPGIKITPRAFGTDHRMPISMAWRAHRRVDQPRRGSNWS